MKHWLASQAQQSGQSLRTIDIDAILIEPDALLQLPALLERASVQAGAKIVLVMDETPMQREGQDLKPFVQALLRNAGYEVEALWLAGDHYGLVHADFAQVERVRAALQPGMAVVALGSGTVTDIAKHAAFLYDQERGLAGEERTATSAARRPTRSLPLPPVWPCCSKTASSARYLRATQRRLSLTCAYSPPRQKH